jgi:hypothetical protein
VDLDADGNLDILSGSYSRHDRKMAGLFQLLRGQPGRAFQKAQTLQGSDGQPLIVVAQRTDDADLDRICTRPFACDLDGDQKLDLVVGNFGGTFAFFRGEGKGAFAPENAWLRHGGVLLQVPHHSDPFLVDWDGDGDLDLLSGSSDGGVFLFKNDGSRTEPEFGARLTLVAPPVSARGEVRFGEGHIEAPGRASRVWAADVDGDQKLDLLLGDQVTIVNPAKGVAEAAARKQLAEWDQKSQELGNRTDAPADAWQKLWEEREKIVAEQMTGFVWLLRRK